MISYFHFIHDYAFPINILKVHTMTVFQNGKVSGPMAQKLTKIEGIMYKFEFLKTTIFVKKLRFLNKNCNFSKYKFLHYSLYLGQFLSYIGPIYHFGIVKVCTLRILIGKSIIMSMRNAMK